MATVHRVGTLEISDDLKFTRLSWKAERIGWLVLAAVLVAGILGLLGSGVFSSATAGEAGAPLRVRFERFAHFEADDRLTVTFRPQVHGGLSSLWIEDRYLDDVEIREIVPTPERIELQPGRKVYYFPTAAGADVIQVWFDLSYKKAGRLAGRIGTSDAPPVELKQFIYP
jgi:hypothetical protein